MQQLRYEICGSAPTTAVEVESDYITGFAKQMGYSYPCPVLPEFNAFWDAMNNASSMVKGERLTLLQAISMCGDLDMSGQRKNVTIIREMDGYREIGTVDLTSKDLFDSPYYYVAQNDIIYVEPNDKMKRQANLDFTPLTVITSVLSFATSILTFVYIFLK